MKLAKSILSIGLIIILALINSSYAEKEKLKNEELFIKVFEETGADFSSLNLNFNGTIPELYNSEEQLKDIMEYIIEELELIEVEENLNNVNDEYMNVHTETFDSTQLVIYGKDNYDNKLTIILYSYYDKMKGDGETSIVIDVNQGNDYANFLEIKKKIDNFYRTYDIKTEITYCIIGAFDAKLNKEAMSKKITSIISMTDGKEIEGLIEDDMMSISAYSPNIDRFIYTGNKKMNLNIALSYNEYEGKTYIFVGYPIITIGY